MLLVSWWNIWQLFGLSCSLTRLAIWSRVLRYREKLPASGIHLREIFQRKGRQSVCQSGRYRRITCEHMHWWRRFLVQDAAPCRSAISLGKLAHLKCHSSSLCANDCILDSCSGAVVEVYNDGNCSSREPTVVSLEPYADKCNPYTGEHDITMGGVTVTVPLYFWTLECTAQPSKPIPVASVALE